MKRSTFLKSLGAMFVAPSLVLAASEKEKTYDQLPTAIEDVSFCVGDVVIFSDGQKALVTANAMGKPQFRAFEVGAKLNTSLACKRLASRINV